MVFYINNTDKSLCFAVYCEIGSQCTHGLTVNTLCSQTTYLTTFITLSCKHCYQPWPPRRNWGSFSPQPTMCLLACPFSSTNTLLSPAHYPQSRNTVQNWDFSASFTSRSITVTTLPRRTAVDYSNCKNPLRVFFRSRRLRCERGNTDLFSRAWPRGQRHCGLQTDDFHFFFLLQLNSNISRKRNQQGFPVRVVDK